MFCSRRHYWLHAPCACMHTVHSFDLGASAVILALVRVYSDVGPPHVPQIPG